MALYIWQKAKKKRVIDLGCSFCLFCWSDMPHLSSVHRFNLRVIKRKGGNSLLTTIIRLIAL